MIKWHNILAEDGDIAIVIDGFGSSREYAATAVDALASLSPPRAASVFAINNLDLTPDLTGYSVMVLIMTPRVNLDTFKSLAKQYGPIRGVAVTESECDINLLEASIAGELELVKADAKRRIDAEAERARQRYLTGGGGQALEYQAVALEARAFAAGEAGPFPFLDSDAAAGVPSVTPQGQKGPPVKNRSEAATAVLTATAIWELKGGEIRAKRLIGKADVEAASTPSEADGAARLAIEALRDV